MFKNIITIFSQWRYLFLAGGVFWVVLSISLFFPHRIMMFQMLSASSMPLLQKLSFVWSMYGVMQSNLTLFTAGYTLAIAVLFGMNSAMIVYFIKRQQVHFKNSKSLFGTGIGGLISGLLGMGCASCGTFVLTGLLSLFGIGGILAYLPLKGQELGLLGIALLIYALWNISNKINAPQVCEDQI